jgi:fluoride exporter
MSARSGAIDETPARARSVATEVTVVTADHPPRDDDNADGIDPDVDHAVPARRWELAGHPWDVLGAIAAGGVIGAEARYGIGLVLPHVAGGWPWATLLINITGCLLIGVLMVVITELAEPHRLVRPFLGVGVLGGYTTFSTYTVDVLSMAEAGRLGPALGYLVATPVAAVLACAAGAGATRQIAGTVDRRTGRDREDGR